MNFFVAFLAGLLTFFSPCIFPLIPSYISYVTGFSVDDLSHGDKKRLLKRSILGSLSFILGFSFIFVLMGISASFAGSLIFQFQNYVRIVGGALIVFFGLAMTGILKIRAFEIEKRFNMSSKPVGYAGALILGMTFAAGWVPCVGPILSSILTIAATSGSRFYGGLLLLSYCLGLGLPVLISAIAFNYFLAFYKHTVKYLKVISIVSGVLLIFIGLLLMTNNLTWLSDHLTRLFMFRGIR
jgi:cytochrome c-type biogenesis protein